MEYGEDPALYYRRKANIELDPMQSWIGELDPARQGGKLRANETYVSFKETDVSVKE